LLEDQENTDKIPSEMEQGSVIMTMMMMMMMTEG
jgi:hypothetical protein